MPEESFIQKFIDCAAHAVHPLSGDKLNTLVEMVLHMEDLEDISLIADLL
jgi:hypothetical protein